MSKDSIVGKVGKFNLCFEEVRLSSHAGMVLVHEFAEKLGVTDLLDEALRVKQRERGYSESELVMGLVNNLVVGGDCLLDLEVLRGDQGTQALLGVTDVLAPTTAGEFLSRSQRRAKYPETGTCQDGSGGAGGQQPDDGRAFP